MNKVVNLSIVINSSTGCNILNIIIGNRRRFN